MPQPLLVAVLANPPSRTTGDRTRKRVDQARIALGLEDSMIVNLFPLPTYRTGEISAAGANAETWIAARQDLSRALHQADSIILGYGVTEPIGDARKFHRGQVAWLKEEIALLKIPVYIVGDGPRHPSRWHRYTSRQHAGVPFETALASSLSRLTT